jgi:hypothetical protein
MKAPLAPTLFSYRRPARQTKAAFFTRTPLTISGMRSLSWPASKKRRPIEPVTPWADTWPRNLGTSKPSSTGWATKAMPTLQYSRVTDDEPSEALDSRNGTA